MPLPIYEKSRPGTRREKPTAGGEDAKSKRGIQANQLIDRPNLPRISWRFVLFGENTCLKVTMIESLSSAGFRGTTGISSSPEDSTEVFDLSLPFPLVEPVLLLLVPWYMETRNANAHCRALLRGVGSPCRTTP